jgi:hypothetical protein
VTNYLATFKSRKWVIQADSLWDAVQTARKILKVPKKDHGLLSVTPATWPDGTPVLHSTTSI